MCHALPAKTVLWCVYSVTVFVSPYGLRCTLSTQSLRASRLDLERDGEASAVGVVGLMRAFFFQNSTRRAGGAGGAAPGPLLGLRARQG